MSIGTRKLNDFFDAIKPWEQLISNSWLKAIDEKKAKHAEDLLTTQRQVASLVEKIRSGTKEESEMEEFLDKFPLENPCSELSINQFFKDNQYLKTKIEQLRKLSPDRSLLLTEIKTTDDVIMKFSENDLYLLHICKQWDEKNRRNALKQMRFFSNLMKNAQEINNTNAIFRVIDHDLHANLGQKPEDSVISHATQGSIVSHSLYKDSLTKLNRIQIAFILKENPYLTEQRLLDWHTDFVNEYPDGELSRNDFIVEFTKLFPRGNPANYCRQVFSTIDNDDSGTIGFVEYMSAVASIKPGNLKTRLGLIFSQCDGDDAKNINSIKIVKFLKVLAEMRGSEMTTDYYHARSIAREMMKICGKGEDEGITKEEFIRCCEEHDDFAALFSEFAGILPLRANAFGILPNSVWKRNGTTVAGGNGRGKKRNQFNHPIGVYVDDNRTIYVADPGNHRIMEWKCDAKNGKVIAGGNGKGSGRHQLNCPFDVIVDKEDSIIISDRANRRIVRLSRQNEGGTNFRKHFTSCFSPQSTGGETIISNIDCHGLTMDEFGYLYVVDMEQHAVRKYGNDGSDGRVVAGGNGIGDGLSQLSSPQHVSVDQDHSVYVSDFWNHRVMKWEKDAKEGIVVAGGNGPGNSLKQLYFPGGVAVDQLGTVYVTDEWNHRVMRWTRGSAVGSVIAIGNDQGERASKLDAPTGLSFDRHGDLYVADMWNDQIQKFEMK